MQIELDGTTKIVMASAVKIKSGAKLTAPNFARDRILIIDPATNCAVATITPLPGARMSPAAPVASEPRDVEAPKAERPEGEERGGRLTDAQREHLTRLCQVHKDKSPQWIAEEFQKRHGRSVSPLTVATCKA